MPPAILDRYVGEFKTSGGSTLTFYRYGNQLTATAGPNPETVIYAHSETRFSFGPYFLEFQLDRQGKATSLIYEQGSQKIQATRTR